MAVFKKKNVVRIFTWPSLSLSAILKSSRTNGSLTVFRTAALVNLERTFRIS